MPLHVRLKQISIVVLVVGMLTGAAIYFMTKDDGDAINDEVVGDQIYSTTPGQYKFAYHDAENIGGQFGVFASQLHDWFFSLWHGKQLGITLCALAIAIAAICYFFSYLLSFRPPRSSEQKSAPAEKRNQ